MYMRDRNELQNWRRLGATQSKVGGGIEINKWILWIWHFHTRRFLWGVELWLHACFNATWNRGDWYSTHIGRFTIREGATGAPLIVGLIVPLPYLGFFEKKYIFFSLGMESSRRFSVVQPEGTQFERVNQFTYLGNQINAQNKRSEEISKRIQAGNRCYYNPVALQP